MKTPQILFSCILLAGISSFATSNHQPLVSAQYYDTTRNEYESVFVPSTEVVRKLAKDLLPQTAVQTMNVQLLLDKLDRAARAKLDSRLRLLPSVYTALFDTKEFLAFAASIPRCVDVPVRWGSGHPDSTRLEKIVLHPWQGINLQNIPAKCVHQKADGATLDALTAWINTSYFDRTKTLCILKFSAPENAIRLSKECDPNDIASTGLVGVPQFLFGAAMNIITLSTGAIEAVVTEENLAAMLAHELAHYYLTHAVQGGSSEYFYKLDEEIIGVKPVRDESQELAGLLAKAAGDSQHLINRTTTQVFREPLYKLALAFLGPVCSGQKTSCSSQCVNAIDDLTSAQRDYRLSYDRADRSLSACGKDVSIGPRFTKEANHLSAVEIASVFDNDSGLKFYRECLGKLPNKGKLSDLLTAMNEKLGTEECNESAVLRKASELKLGYYTDEQEADVYALKILRAAGYKQTAIVGLMNELANLSGDPGCKKWEADQVGNPVPLLKDYSDPHHETCFRAHYLNRLINSQKPF